MPKTVLHDGKFLTLIKEGCWEYVDRANAVGAATLIYGGTNGSALKYNDVQRPFFPDAPLVSLKGLPVNEARMVIVKEDGPFGTSPLANAFAQSTCFSLWAAATRR